MRTLSWRLEISLLLFWGTGTAFTSSAFSVGYKGHKAALKNPSWPKIGYTLRTVPASPLRYRLAEEEDNETTLLRVKNRAPPGFDMRKNIKEQEQEAIENPPKSAVNRALVKALLWNQALVLFLGTVVATAAFLFSDGFEVFGKLDSVAKWNGDFAAILPSDANRVLVGVMGALPALAFSNLVESSDRREFANVNFSTIIMVLTLFGRRSRPPDEFLPEALQDKPILTTSSTQVVLNSLVLSTVTGFCEETIFRGEIPSLMSRFLGWDPIAALFGSAFAFGLGHAQPGTGIKETSVVVGLQAVNGLWFGFLYLLTGGDIGTCMITHAVFDFVVFFKTWSDANDQIEYANRMCLETLDEEAERELQAALRSAPRKMEPRILTSVKRLFYTFDFDKNRTLSLSEVRKGLSYYALERQGTPPRQEQVDELFAKVIAARRAPSSGDSNRLDLADFITLTNLSSEQQKAASIQ